MHYRNLFNVQAGWLQNLSHSYSDKMKRTFPFVSTSFDVLRTFVPAAKAGVKLFVSYAVAGDFADLQDTLKDFVPVNHSANTAFPYYGSAYDTAWHIMTAGAVFHAWNNRLMVNYYFERRHFNEPMELNLPPNFTRQCLVAAKSVCRLSMAARKIKGAGSICSYP